MKKLLLAIGLVLAAFLCPAADISLGWLSSSDPDVTGYNLYYGSASGIYTNKVLVGSATSTTISGLVNGQTYYFAATTYNSSGVEAPFSAEISYAVPLVQAGSPPVITNSVLTNSISVGGTWTFPVNGVGIGALTYSLGAGAPSGFTVNPTNGLMIWNPGISQASTTNIFTVNVTDSQTPAQTTAQTFTVIVQDYACLSLGSTVLAKSNPGLLPLAVYASLPITNFQVVLTYPSCLLTNLSLTATNPLISSFSLISNAPGEILINVGINPSNAFSGWQSLGTIGFNSFNGDKTEAVAINAINLSAIKTDGTLISDFPPASAQVMLVGHGILLQAGITNGVRQLVVYGPVGASYTVQTSTDLTSPTSWTAITPTTSMTNLCQTWQFAVDNSNARFYRTQRFQ